VKGTRVHRYFGALVAFASSGGKLGILLRFLPIESRQLGAVLLNLLRQELPLRGNQLCAGAFGRMKSCERVECIAEGRMKPCGIEFGGDEVTPQVLALCLVYGRIELDEDVTRLDALAIRELGWREPPRFRRAG
jgi:hypothetical protein